MIPNFLKRILAVFGVLEQEAPSAILMALYFFLAMSAVSITKSVQNALYLGRVGFDWKLPLLYLLLAVVSMAVVALMGRMAQHYSRIFLNASTLILLTFCFFFFLFLLDSETPIAYPLFYVFGGVFSVLVPTQGWMLSYELYSYRQAKRLFSLLGTGGILGGAGGGYYAAAMASFGIESHWLLVHVCVVLLSMQLLLLVLRRSRRIMVRKRPQRWSDSPPVPPLLALRSSSYLKYLAGMVLVSACVGTLIDLQYKWVLEEKYSGSPTEIVQFFGYLLGTMFIFSALFQLLAMSRMLRRFGVAVTAMILPIALLAGAIPVVVWAAFGAVIAIKVIDGCLRTSLHKTSTELLFIPTFNEGTVAVKGFIDLVVFRIGDALAAAVFLVLLSVTSGPMKAVGIAMMVVALIWLLLANRLSGEYLRGLRRRLELGTTSTSPLLDVTLGGESELALVRALESTRTGKVLFALRELISRMPERREAQLSTTDGSSSVVYRLFQHQTPGWLPTVEHLLEHRDQEVAAAALHLLVGYEPEEHRHRLDTVCTSSSKPSLLCLAYLDRYSDYDSSSQVEPEKMVEWSRHGGVAERRVIASLMRKNPRSEFEPILLNWVAQEDHSLSRAALAALGGFRSADYVELLLSHLEQDWSRAAARLALANYGDGIIQQLTSLGLDSKSGPEIRREVPRILTQVASPAAQESLLSLLYVSDPLVSYRALKGLNKIRTTRKLVFGEAALLPILQLWVQQHYELLNLDQMLSGTEQREEKLLKKTVLERLEWSTEKIFRGLELVLPQGDAYFSYLGFTGDDPSLRENAVELLEMRVKGELRKTVIPILTGQDARELARQGRELFNLPSDYERVLSDTLFTADPWLKCCIIAVVLNEKRQPLRTRVETASEDVHPLVRETALWALEAWPA